MSAIVSLSLSLSLVRDGRSAPRCAVRARASDRPTAPVYLIVQRAMYAAKHAKATVTAG